MAKKKVVKKSPTKTAQPVMLTQNQFNTMAEIVRNDSYTLHRELLNRLLTSSQSDLDQACGYASTLSVSNYRDMYDRLGLARRAVQIWPEECWQEDPLIYEKEEPEPTPFETAWKELQVQRNLFSYLQRIDVLSGIGSFGVLLLGLDDGRPLNMPVAGANEMTGDIESPTEHRLLFLRAFDESVVTINETQNNPSSPRYGLPVKYSVKFREGGSAAGVFKEYTVHWSRVIHIADNRETSEVYGISRLQTLYNHLHDIKKVSGGSAEMFWKGGFPGYAFELSPEAIAQGAELDTDSIKEQMVLWSTGLQRWLSLQGVTTKSLNPQVADPTGHLEIHLKLVALALGVPYRVLLGTEEAKLASVQDKRTWNTRVAKRQNSYLTPWVLRPFVDRLVAIKALPQPEQYFVEWPDLNASTEDDVAKVALNRTDAFAKYVQGGVDNLVPPQQYLTQIHKMTEEEAKMILDAMENYESELNPEPEPEPVPRQTKPTGAQGS